MIGGAPDAAEGTSNPNWNYEMTFPLHRKSNAHTLLVQVWHTPKPTSHVPYSGAEEEDPAGALFSSILDLFSALFQLYFRLKIDLFEQVRHTNTAAMTVAAVAAPAAVLRRLVVE